MNLNLHSGDKVRISTDMENNFIDIRGMDFEQGISLDLYPFCQYIEIRKCEKTGYLRLFAFKNKRVKKDMDLGYWKDKEVIFSLNKVQK